MGCNNSHLRPFFRRCRRRRSKKDDPSVTPKGDYIEMERNGSGDLTQGIHFLGASLRNANNKTADPATAADSTFCVPLLAQAEASSSQIDFFKMLDEKIEEGPDYDSEEDKDPLRSGRGSFGWKKVVDSGGAPDAGPLRSGSESNHYSWDEDGD